MCKMPPDIKIKAKKNKTNITLVEQITGMPFRIRY